MSLPAPPDASRAALISPPLVLSGAALALAGALIGGSNLTDPPVWIVLLSAALLSGAGYAFSRFFATARPGLGPERTLPPVAQQAWHLGWITLIPGAVLPGLLGLTGSLTAIGVALLMVLYAAVTRTQWGAGFATFGAARGLTLVLGMSAAAMGPERFWHLALPVLVYGVGWDLLRSARQPGAPPSTAFVALAHLVAAVSLALYQATGTVFHWTEAFPFLILMLAVAFPRFVSAVMLVGTPPVSQAVQYGLLGEVLLAAALTGGYNGLLPGLAVAAVGLPVFMALERWPIPLINERR